ncbi:expressed unknown protein [Ectocarpus siliculosus]|uniref:Uncharacterized protein n=1 Tax=Ectocarpus siliculosus TaxID=2880 RepID=D7FZ55_ECTSI|nr:expressed unknown protein [Ectocarpus siliculosus]|eukprot:CBJ32672.1 expressed unknown protein [Ectocarpus siliculosus]
MSQAVKRISPFAGVAAGGLVAGAAGLWAWRSKRDNAVKGDATTAPAPAPAPAPSPPLQRTGPMVAVYLDDSSIEKLQMEYPGTKPGRLRKVVIEYDPSDEQRGLYEPRFGGSATVKVTGEACSDNRLALVASVSSAGTSVEPPSLSCAVDVTPGDVGGGPLGSTVLIEQIKRVGALAEDSWKGLLPPLSAHERDFPSEEGSYNKLDEPLTLTGSICRADWVEPMTGVCRTTTAGGGKREDGWTPQACSICNTLESSPCRDIHKKFDAVSTRIYELQPTSETSSDGSKPPGTSSGSSSAKDDERGLAEAPGGGGGDDKQTEATEVVAGSDRGAGRSGTDIASEGSAGPAVGGGDENALSGRHGGHSPSRKGEVGEKESVAGGSGEPETEEERLRREELEVLEDKRMVVMVEMFRCSKFHHVLEDSYADDGLVPGMLGDDEEGEEGDAAPGGASASESGGAVKVEEGEAK